jgi:hypothetical protein
VLMAVKFPIALTLWREVSLRGSSSCMGENFSVALALALRRELALAKEVPVNLTLGREFPSSGSCSWEKSS